MDVGRLLALVHVGSALLFVTGFVSTGTLTQLARQTSDPDERRRLLTLSGRFDFWYQIPFGTLTALSGLAVTAANGLAWATPWIATSIVLYALVTFSGAVLWRRHSALVRDALDQGNDARVRELLTSARSIAQTWFDRILVAAIVVLMILRPT
jgi:hypothetical protein